MPKKTKEFPAFLGVNISQELMDAIQRKVETTNIQQSRLIRPVLESAFLPKKRLEDKQNTGKLRK